MNYHDQFRALLGELIDLIKLQFFERHTDIFDRVDFFDDDIYLEPLLYSYLSQKDDSFLDGILLGYEKNPKQRIIVYTSGEGVVYVPRIGYFLTSIPNSELVLQTAKNQYALYSNDMLVAFDFESLEFADDVEVQKYIHPLQERFFKRNDKEQSLVVIKDLYKYHTKAFKEGLQLLKRYNPKLYNLLTICLKRVMFFNAVEPNSFATIAAHNMIFFNVKEWSNRLFFLDHLSHEGAHIVFFTLTYQSKLSLFNVPWNTKFSEVSGKDYEHGNIYLRFHGLFTYVEITLTLHQLLIHYKANDRLLFEARGRMAFHIERFRLSLSAFTTLNIFNDHSEIWYEYFKNSFNSIEAQYSNLQSEFNLSNQPYDFNTEKFFINNPF